MPKNRMRLFEELGLRGKICVEVGVRAGRNALRILNCHLARLYLVDYWGDVPGYQDARNTNAAKYEELYQEVVAKYGNDPRVTIIRDLSTNAASKFEKESVDMIYLDANHSRESTYADLRAWYPALKPGGWMCGHDYFEQECWSGVKPAVQQFLKENSLQLGALTKADKFPSFGFRKPTYPGR